LSFPEYAAPAANVGLRISRIELYRPVEVGDGAISVALGTISGAAADIGPCILRIELFRPVEVGDYVCV